MQQIDHDSHLLSAFEKVKKISPLSYGWKVSDKNSKLGFINHVMSDSETGLKATRGEGTINFCKARVVQILEDQSLATQINKKVKSSEVVATTSKGYKIKYSVFSPAIGDDRDTLQIHGVFEENGEVYFVGSSVVDDKIKPEVQGKVRATHYYQLYKLSPVGETQTIIVYVSCIDPKGSYPGFIKDKMNNARGIEQLININDYLSKNQ